MEPISCAICESPIRAEIEKNDALWKDIETIKWARKKGLNISRFSLIKHRTNHLQSVPGTDNGNSDDNGNKNDRSSNANIIEANDNKFSPLPAMELSNMIEKNSKKPSKRTRKLDKPETITPIQADDAPSVTSAKAPSAIPTAITDQLLLDTVRDRVYQKLLNGEIELGLGDGFKAIEIKHKIADQSQNEKLLLEILNEIRSQELKGVMASHDTQ